MELGDDSFFIELTSDGPLEEQAIESVIALAVDVIKNRKAESTCEVDSTEYKVILKDYYEGERKADVSKQDVERWFENNIIGPQTMKAFLSPFDEDQTSPRSYIDILIKSTEEGEIVTKSGTAYEFNFPIIDSKYYNRIVDTTLKSGRKDLKNRSPAVLFLYLPASETDDMERYYVQEGRYDPTPQIRRLEQRIEGQLNNSKSVNAVVLNNTFFSTDGNNCRVERGYKVFNNPSAENPLPNDFKQYLK